MVIRYDKAFIQDFKETDEGYLTITRQVFSLTVELMADYQWRQNCLMNYFLRQLYFC